MPANDSLIGGGLVDSPYAELKKKHEDLLLFLRIAHDGYPQSEARWGSLEEFYDEHKETP